jgi:hypothetical protein
MPNGMECSGIKERLQEKWLPLFRFGNATKQRPGAPVPKVFETGTLLGPIAAGWGPAVAGRQKPAAFGVYRSRVRCNRISKAPVKAFPGPMRFKSMSFARRQTCNFRAGPSFYVRGDDMNDLMASPWFFAVVGGFIILGAIIAYGMYRNEQTTPREQVEAEAGARRMYERDGD